MCYKDSVFDLVKSRRSWRSYEDLEIEYPLFSNLSDFISKNNTGPFGNKTRFSLIDTGKGAGVKRPGTYGIIRGARYYIAGLVRKGPLALVDYGYCLEKAVLFATQEGLGTCWLGGTFDRGAFREKVAKGPEDILPAVTPVGFPAKKSIIDRTIKSIARSHKRKRWEEVFFEKALNDPLDPKKVPVFEDILEMVRIAPSASNRQPWRIIADQGDIFHFYIYRSRIISAYPKTDLQQLDAGIAICHFDLCAKEKGLKGKWTVSEPGQLIKKERHTYIASWVPA
jgi:nitroreductase